MAGGRGTGTPAIPGRPDVESILHTDVSEKIEMNKYHLLWVMERLSKKSKGPHLEHVAIFAAMLLGVLFTLLPADFGDYLGRPAAVWEALATGVTVFAGLATLFLFIWWVVNKCKERTQTPEDVVNEIIDQMAKDRERLSGVRNPQETDTEG